MVAWVFEELRLCSYESVGDQRESPFLNYYTFKLLKLLKKHCGLCAKEDLHSFVNLNKSLKWEAKQMAKPVSYRSVKWNGIYFFVVLMLK